MYSLHSKFEQNQLKIECTMTTFAYLLFILKTAILDVGRGCLVQALVHATYGHSTPNPVSIHLMVSEEKIFEEWLIIIHVPPLQN